MSTDKPAEFNYGGAVLITSSSNENAEVKALSRAFDEFLKKFSSDESKYHFIGPSGDKLPVPESVFLAMRRVLQFMSHGDAVTIGAVTRVLEPEEAAELLNFPLEYLRQLLDEGKIPYENFAEGRQLRLEDVVAFKLKSDKEVRAGISELMQLTQQFGGYDAELK